MSTTTTPYNPTEAVERLTAERDATAATLADLMNERPPLDKRGSQEWNGWHSRVEKARAAEKAIGDRLATAERMVARGKQDEREQAAALAAMAKHAVKGASRPTRGHRINF